MRPSQRGGTMFTTPQECSTEIIIHIVSYCRRNRLWIRPTAHPDNHSSACQYSNAYLSTHARTHPHQCSPTDRHAAAKPHGHPVTNRNFKYRFQCRGKVPGTFDYSLNAPKGWGACSGFEPVWSLEQSHLAVSSQAGKYGTLFYYADEMIHPNEAVYFLFAFEGNQNQITLGFDGYDNGKVCDNNKNQLGFYSVALEDYPGMPLTIHSIINTAIRRGYFKGDWRLQEKSWYGILMGFDQSNTFFMTIWKPGDPGQKLEFQQAYADFPKAYNFISWTGTARKVWIDDFSILTFDGFNKLLK